MRPARSTKKIPTAASRNSGVNFNAANAVIARAPSFTPNAFKANSTPYTAVNNNARGTGGANAGIRLATCTDKAAATPALDPTLLIHISAPARNPANWPNVALK